MWTIVAQWSFSIFPAFRFRLNSFACNVLNLTNWTNVNGSTPICPTFGFFLIVSNYNYICFHVLFLPLFCCCGQISCLCSLALTNAAPFPLDHLCAWINADFDYLLRLAVAERRDVWEKWWVLAVGMTFFQIPQSSTCEVQYQWTHVACVGSIFSTYNRIFSRRHLVWSFPCRYNLHCTQPWEMRFDWTSRSTTINIKMGIFLLAMNGNKVF